jgi:HSP20 family molecular chaperone IbpA
MNDFLRDFDAFFSDLDGWFGKPRHLMFQCKTKDMTPSFYEKTDDGYKCTCRTVGINAEDVKVTLEDDCIHVEGKTELDGYKYSTSYDLPLTEDVINNIKNIKYKTANGITIIYIDLDRPEKKKVKIEQI